MDIRLKPAVALPVPFVFKGQPRAGVVRRLRRGKDIAGGGLRMSEALRLAFAAQEK